MNTKNLFSALLLSSVIMLPSAALATTHRQHDNSPKREYNCRMPRRDNRPGASAPAYNAADPLFGGLGLSPQQSNKVQKLHSKYDRDMTDYMRKINTSTPARAERYRAQAMKCEAKFLSDVRMVLNPSQYRGFEMRFRPVFGAPANSAPRPGQTMNGVGPVIPGPQPTLMTKPGK